MSEQKKKIEFTDISHNHYKKIDFENKNIFNKENHTRF